MYNDSQSNNFGGSRGRMDQETVNNLVSGVLVVDKPVGLTSHDVVQIIRRGTGIRRAGHTGTLDPRASGVLVVLIGPAVRLSEFVSAEDKRYQATIKLGSSTDTYDAEGISSEPEVPVNVSREQFNCLPTSLVRSNRPHRHTLQSKWAAKKLMRWPAAVKKSTWPRASSTSTASNCSSGRFQKLSSMSIAHRALTCVRWPMTSAKWFVGLRSWEARAARAAAA